MTRQGTRIHRGAPLHSLRALTTRTLTVTRKGSPPLSRGLPVMSRAWMVKEMARPATARDPPSTPRPLAKERSWDAASKTGAKGDPEEA